MNEKNKIILDDSIDAVVSGIAGLGIAWGLSKAFYGAGMKLRQQRVLEWVEMVRDNPEIFIKEVLGSEQFQDGFVFAFEKYLTERSEEKRKILRSIFLDFSMVDSKKTFALEKFTHTLSVLSEKDIFVLKDVDVSKTNDRNYQVYGNSERDIDNIFSLINAGILLHDPSSRLGPVQAPFVRITSFGIEFIKFIKSN